LVDSGAREILGRAAKERASGEPESGEQKSWGILRSGSRNDQRVENAPYVGGLRVVGGGRGRKVEVSAQEIGAQHQKSVFAGGFLDLQAGVGKTRSETAAVRIKQDSNRLDEAIVREREGVNERGSCWGLGQTLK
jgi:hypothetical protein